MLSFKYSVNLPPKKKKAANVGGISAFLVCIYAIAVGITPEFDFLGIPKVRITDLLLPIILVFSFDSKPKGKKTSLPFAGLITMLMLWDLGSLIVWGEAKLKPGLFYLAKRLVFFLVAYVSCKAIRDIATWNRVVRLLVFTSPILSLSVLHELAANRATTGILSTTEGMRASGIIANQQTSTALYIAAISCLALGAWNAFPDLAWRFGSLVSLATGTMAIFATGSRGGLGCVVLGLVLTVLQRPRQAVTLLFLAALFGSIAWVITPTELQGRMAALFPETQATLLGLTTGEKELEVGSSSIADRAYAVQFAMKHWIPSAGLIGLGTGWKRLGAIDDFYVDEWLYHGLIGLVLFLVLQARIIVGCVRIARKATDPVEKGVASGAATAFIVMSFSGFHADTFYLIRPMEMMALLLGLVAGRRAMAERESSAAATMVGS